MSKFSLKESIRVYTQKHMLAMLALGFSSGLPFLLVLGTLSARLKEAGITNTEIGFMSWVGFAYGFKFIWSPLLDHIQVPMLGTRIGQRRSWMIISQILVALGLIGLSFCDPKISLGPTIFFALLAAFASSTQDIAVDAWRIEVAHEDEQGNMAAIYQLGYRFAIMTSGGGALILAGKYNWQTSYILMALLMSLGMLTAFLAPAELKPHVFPEKIKHPIRSAIIAPFLDFFKRYKWTALIMLALISAYRIPDFVMGVMARPFYLDKGFTLSEIGTVSSVYGVWVTIIGAILGGVFVSRLGLLKALLIGAILGSGSNLIYVWLDHQNNDIINLFIAITAENLSGGIAGTALIAYMSSLTNKAFTATQYALLSSFYALLAKFLGGFSGVAVDQLGYSYFFAGTAFIGVPAIILVLMVSRRGGIIGLHDKR